MTLGGYAQNLLRWVMTVDKMDFSKIANWVQITATVGVIIGVAVVVIELRQAKVLAEAEITAQFFAESAQNARAQMGENPAFILSKACLRPSEVTDEELFVLDGYFSTQWALADRTYRLEMIAEFGLPWQDISRKTLQRVARLEHGRKWLAHHVSFFNPNFEEVVSEMLKENENTSCEDFLNDLRLDG